MLRPRKIDGLTPYIDTEAMTRDKVWTDRAAVMKIIADSPLGADEIGDHAHMLSLCVQSLIKAVIDQSYVFTLAHIDMLLHEPNITPQQREELEIALALLEKKGHTIQ